MITLFAYPFESTHCFCIINRLGTPGVPAILTPHCVPMPKASIRGKTRHLSHGDPPGTGLLSLSPARAFCYALSHNHKLKHSLSAPAYNGLVILLSGDQLKCTARNTLICFQRLFNRTSRSASQSELKQVQSHFLRRSTTSPVLHDTP